MLEDLQQRLNNNGYQDWKVVDDEILACPHGNHIEWDGTVPGCGCSSPLLTLGILGRWDSRSPYYLIDEIKMDDLQRVLNESGYQDWEVADPSLLTCPDGYNIELDGFLSCECRCRSPLLTLGIRHIGQLSRTRIRALAVELPPNRIFLAFPTPGGSSTEG